MNLRNLLLSRSIFVSQSIDVIYYFQSFCLTTTQSPLSEYSLQSNPSKRTENFYQVTALVIFVTYVIKNLYKNSFHLRHQLLIQVGCHQCRYLNFYLNPINNFRVVQLLVLHAFNIYTTVTSVRNSRPSSWLPWLMIFFCHRARCLNLCQAVLHFAY